METLDGNSDQYATVSSNSPSSSSGGFNSSDDHNNGSVSWYGMRLPSVNPLRSPLSLLLDYSGILTQTHDSGSVIVNNGVPASEIRSQVQMQPLDDAVGGSAGEVAIRIIGAGEHDQNQIGEVGFDGCDNLMGERRGAGMSPLDDDPEGRGGAAVNETVPLVSSSASLAGSVQGDGDAAGNGAESDSRGSSSYQRYDIQQVAKWIEQILPFSLLLLIVFIRQHLQGITPSVSIQWFCCFMSMILILLQQNHGKAFYIFLCLLFTFYQFMIYSLPKYWGCF